MEVFRDEYAVVYNGDFQEIIDTLTFDFIITDPPYNINYKYPDYKDSLNSDKYIEMLSRLEPYKVIMIHYPEAFCGDVGEALGCPQKCVTWCYNSNLLRQSRMIAWFGCSPDFSLVRQPYKNLNDKRIKSLINSGSSGSRL